MARGPAIWGHVEIGEPAPTTGQTAPRAGRKRGGTPTTRIVTIARYPEGVPGAQAGQVMNVRFELDGQEFLALNGGPHFKFTEAISLLVNCENQEEVDRLWTKLTEAGGSPSQCGWLKDRYGLSWQIIPTALVDLLNDPDPARARRATAAMLQMQKIDIKTMRRAADGIPAN